MKLFVRALAIALCFTLKMGTLLADESATATQTPPIAQPSSGLKTPPPSEGTTAPSKPTSPKPPAAPQQAPSNPDDVAALNRIAGTCSTLFKDCSVIIQHIARLIHQARIGTFSTQNASLEFLAKANGILLQVQSTYISTPLTPEKLHIALRVAQNLSYTIREALEGGLTDLPSLSYERLTKRPKKPITSLKKLAYFALDTREIVDELQEFADKNGLNIFNRVYGSFSNLVFKSHIVPITIGLGALAFLTTTGVLAFGPESWLKWSPTLKKVRAALGINQNDPRADELAAKGECLDYLEAERRFTKTLTILGSITTIATGVSTLLSIPQIWTWTKTQAAKVDRYLRGTDYNLREGEQYVTDNDLDKPQFDYIRPILAPLYDILSYIRDPEGFIATGIPVAKGILIRGCPGSGKTEIAHAFAGHLNKLTGGRTAIIFVDIRELEIPDKFKEILQHAREIAPCVIFIDEVHLAARGLQIEKNPTAVTEFLKELDKLDRDQDPRNQIFVVLATNHPDLVYAPILRPGRISVIIDLANPHFEQRKTILASFCRTAAADPEAIDLDRLALITQGVTVSSLKKMFERALFLAKQSNEQIKFEHLYQAVDETIRHIIPGIHLTEQEREALAIHWAGVALAYVLLDCPVQLDAVTLQAIQRKVAEKPDWVAKMVNDNERIYQRMYGSIFAYNIDEFLLNRCTAQDPFMWCKIRLAGIVAEEVVLSVQSDYDKEAFQEAYETALARITHNMDLKKLPKAVQEELRLQAWQKVSEAVAALKELFAKNESKLRRLADELKKKEFMRIEQIRAVIDEA